jgi:uncharacterized protein (TIGR03437 family)
LLLAVSCCGFSQSYTIQTVAGGALPVNIAGTSASVGPVLAIAVDQAGNAYFSAGNYGLVLRLDAQTGMLTIAAGTGIEGYSSGSGPVATFDLGYITGVAVDNSGNLFLLDQTRVREVSGGVVTTIAGNGAFGYSGDGGPALSAEWRQPNGIAVDASGNVYIADTGNNRIRRIANGVITTVAGNGAAGFAGDGGAATSAELSSPNGVAVDSSGNLYIADTGNARVRKVSAGTITTVAGNGTPGSTGDGGPAIAAELTPYAIAVGSTGNLYIVEFPGSISEVSNGVINTVAGNGTPGFSGDAGPAISAELNQPMGVAVDSSGDIFIADYLNDRVRKVTDGIIETAAGGGGVGDNGPATKAQLDAPEGIAIDSNGNLYIADSGSNRVREIARGYISTAAGDGISGYSGDNGPPNKAELAGPTAVALDSGGDLYIVAGSEVRKIAGGAITTVVGTNGLTNNVELIAPFGLTVDSAGNLYIANTYGDDIIEISNGTATTIAGTQFNAGYSGDSGPAARAQLNAPYGIALDSAGSLYFADANNAAVRKISKGVITTIAGSGVPGFGGDNGPATNAQLYFPTGVALDSAGNLYIADNANDRVRKVSGGVITTIAGSGVHGFGGDGGPATAALLDAPFDVAVDTSGDVYFSEGGSNRLRMLTPSGASACTFGVSPLSFTATTAGGSFTATVQTPSGCSWAVESFPSWMAFSANAVNTGAGSVTVNVSANSGNERTVYISVAGVSIQVIQQGLLSVNVGGIVNGASYAAAVAPGSIAAVYGDFPITSAVTDTTLPLLTQVPLPGSLSEFFLYFPNMDAPLFYASAGQTNIQIPWEFAGQTQTTLGAATGDGKTGIPQTVTLAPAAPGIFAMNSQGNGQGAILDVNYHLVDESNPVSSGSTVLIYCTGLGAVSNAPPTGSPASLDTLSQTPELASVTIGGATANVSFSGLAPGYVGLYQVNAQVPTGLAVNNATPVVVSMGGVISNTVTMAVQ